MARLLLALAILGNFFELLSFPPIAHADSPPSDGSSTQNQIGNKHPFIYKTPLTVDLERTSWSGSQTIVDAVGARQPTRFRSSSVANWSALKWDFWELSSRWSILLDVLVLNHPLFIFSEVLSLSPLTIAMSLSLSRMGKDWWDRMRTTALR